MSSLGNKPIIVVIGLVASIITIVVFFSGKQNIGGFMSEPTILPSSPIVVTVIVKPENDSNANANPSAQPIASLQKPEPQFDPNDPEGFLRWYFHQIWESRNYEYLWTYLSVDFRDRIGLSYSYYEENWNAIGSIEEPIDISYEGKDEVSLKYRVQYTTLSMDGNYPDHRKDLYWLYFNQSKDHWEFK